MDIFESTPINWYTQKLNQKTNDPSLESLPSECKQMLQIVEALKNQAQSTQTEVQIKLLYNASKVFWQHKLTSKCFETMSDLIVILQEAEKAPEKAPGLSLNQIKETLFIVYRANARICMMNQTERELSDAFYLKGLRRFLNDGVSSLGKLQKTAYDLNDKYFVQTACKVFDLNSENSWSKAGKKIPKFLGCLREILSSTEKKQMKRKILGLYIISIVYFNLPFDANERTLVLELQLFEENKDYTSIASACQFIYMNLPSRYSSSVKDHFFYLGLYWSYISDDLVRIQRMAEGKLDDTFVQLFLSLSQTKVLNRDKLIKDLLSRNIQNNWSNETKALFTEKVIPLLLQK